MALPGVAPNSLKVMVVGSGGREHALACSIQTSTYVSEVLIAPGNAGTVGPGLRRLTSVDAESVDSIVSAAKLHDIDLAVIGPEVPLVKGVVDALRAEGVRAFGPTSAAAALEGSKSFSKDFMLRHGIPTAKYQRFTDIAAARAYVVECGAPIVVKADGLAAGKGVVVAQTVDEAFAALDAVLGEKKFGDAGSAAVVEEFLEGEELSFFAVCDGKYAVPLASAQDHKAAYDGDMGPNTGGMGAYSPAPVCSSKLAEQVMQKVVRPTVNGMAAEGAAFAGVLFIGLMVDEKGDFKVLEYNVRFGDPECQVLCARLRSDMCELLWRATEGSLVDYQADWSDEKAIVVVMASKGYPGSYKKGQSIGDIAKAEEIAGVRVYHAGTKEVDGNIVNDGGRVLGLTAVGPSITEAQKTAYEGVGRIEWEGGMFRKDIGWRAIKREEESLIETR